MKNVVKFESKPKAEKKGFVVKTAVKAGFNPGDVAGIHGGNLDQITRDGLKTS